MNPPRIPTVETAVQLLALLAWGTHVTVPWRLRRGGAVARRRWALAALPLLLAALVAVLVAAASRPEAVLAAGLHPARPGLALASLPPLLLALLALDLLLLAARERLEAAGWVLAAGFGLAALLAVSYGAELLRAGAGPLAPPLPLAGAVLCRALLALGAGEIAAPGRPAWTLAAAAALPLYLLLLPPPVFRLLLGEGAALTAGAAALLLALARWLPPALRRPALAGGIFLAALLLARATLVSDLLMRNLPAGSPLPPLPG